MLGDEKAGTREAAKRKRLISCPLGFCSGFFFFFLGSNAKQDLLLMLNFLRSCLTQKLDLESLFGAHLRSSLVQP